METHNGTKRHKRQKLESGWSQASEPGGEATRSRKDYRVNIPNPTEYHQLRVPNRTSGPDWPEREDGHYNFAIGDNFTPRFKIMRTIGEGTFGRVVECWDRINRRYVAIKITKSREKYKVAAQMELTILATLAAHDPECQQPVLRLKEWFEYRGHISMVFNKLGPSMFDLLRLNKFRGLPLGVAQTFMRQILQAVSYMHSLGMVHTDLKPENILLLDDVIKNVRHARIDINGRRSSCHLPSKRIIKLIDFGSAIFLEDHHPSLVSTRHYRAPEVILQIGWSQPCDVWSMGCLFMELLTGQALFQTREDLEHLAMIEAAIGKIPSAIALAACQSKRKPSQSSAQLFDNSGQTVQLNWPAGAQSKRSVTEVAKIKSIKAYLSSVISSYDKREPFQHLLHLLSHMLAWEPSKRISARAALLHPFFMTQLD